MGVTGELLINDLLNGPSEACLGGVSNAAGPPVQQSRTLDSSSIQEFFDAEEYLTTSGDSTEVRGQQGAMEMLVGCNREVWG